MKLSVIIPVYNEIHTLDTILSKVVVALPEVTKEIVLVDDCSSDGTRQWLEANFGSHENLPLTINLGANYLPVHGLSVGLGQFAMRYLGLGVANNPFFFMEQYPFKHIPYSELHGSGHEDYFSNEYRDVSENFVLDATAFKVRELSLSYSLNQKALDAIGFSSVRVGVNARNPFVVLPKENRGYADPEFSNTTGNAQGLSVSGQYPATRSYGLSVNLTF